MRTAITVSTFVVAALLPGLARASTDAISAEGGHYCNSVANTIVIGEVKPNPMARQIDALANGTSDQVLQSYYRDLYREPGSFSTEQFVTTPDPYVEAITFALYGSAEPGARPVC